PPPSFPTRRSSDLTLVQFSLGEQMERFIEYMLRIGAAADPRRVPYPGLRNQPWYPASEIALARELEANFFEIRKEALAVLGSSGFQMEGETINRMGSWEVFMLYELGRKVARNCERCPVTAGLISSNETLHSSISGSIYYSVLAA